MKKILLFMIAIIMVGCTSITQTPLLYVERTKTAHGIDFTDYSEKGFFITPEKYLGNYESVGLVNFSISSGAILEKILVSKADEMAKKAGITDLYHYKWNIEEINYKEILDFAYNISIEMGGDAIVNFEINYDVQYYDNANGYPSVFIPEINVTGFVIKRKMPNP